jgi:hypothetical protein
MKSYKGIAMAAVLALGAAVAGNAFAQGAPISGGNAGIVYTPTLTTVAPCPANTTTVGGCPAGTETAIDVAINLTGLTGLNCVGAATPAILGGYQIAMEFDTTRLFYAGTATAVAGGDGTCGARPGEYGNPTSTNATDANTTGTALFVGQNGADQTAPTGGPFCYFRIRLQGKSGIVGTANATVRFRTNARGAYTLSSAVLNCAPNPNVGPVDIPKNNDVSVVLVTTPVELTNFQAE